MRLFKRACKGAVSEEEDSKMMAMAKAQVAELEATEGRHSCRDCDYASYYRRDINNTSGVWRCTLSRPTQSSPYWDIDLLLVGATGEHDAVFRRWNECAGFMAKRECKLCIHNDEEAMRRPLADGAVVSRMPSEMCAHYEYNDNMSAAISREIDCAMKCKNFKYTEESE